jgi:hypothetical protein
MKLKIISFCLFFVIIILSCKKEEPLIVSNANVSLLSQVITDNQPSLEYTYNGANLMSDEKTKYDLSSYHYNDKNQLLSVDCYANYSILSADQSIAAAAMNQTAWVTASSANKAGTINFEYDSDGKLVKSTYTPLSGSSQYSQFSYDANNKITTQSLYWDNKESGYISYLYDDKGNLIKESLYNLATDGVAELSTTTQYEYDNQQNPFKPVSKLLTPGVNTNQNNVIKETYSVSLKTALASDDVYVTQNTYEYSPNGFPISKNGNVKYVYK